MKLVILATDSGRRFGGPRALTPVGARGETALDYTVIDAFAAGYDGVVIVTAAASHDELVAHGAETWPPELNVEIVALEGLGGTGPALLAARSRLEGSFAVCNADDLYGPESLKQLREQLAAGDGTDDVAGLVADTGAPDAPHVLLGFRLADTIASTRPVVRGLCHTDLSRNLLDIVDTRITWVEEGNIYAARPLDAPDGSAVQPLAGDQTVSMNLWGFRQRIFDHVEAAIEAFEPPPAEEGVEPPELILPDVVRSLVIGAKDSVTVATSASRCLGIDHPDDVDLVRAELARRRPGAIRFDHGIEDSSKVLVP